MNSSGPGARRHSGANALGTFGRPLLHASLDFCQRGAPALLVLLERRLASRDKRGLCGSPLDFLAHGVLDELRKALAFTQHGLGLSTHFGLNTDRGESSGAHGRFECIAIEIQPQARLRVPSVVLGKGPRRLAVRTGKRRDKT
jgi:hypothetical protein